jgi:hypothetical protein
VNGCWFTSLALSLSLALLAVLIKQWIQNLYAPLPSAAPRNHAKVRFYRLLGLHAWNVPAVIHILPVLLHLSLLIFFAGLVVFLHPVNVALSWIVSMIGFLAYAFYFITTLIPLWKPQCPYRSPLLQVVEEASKLLEVWRCFAIDHCISFGLAIARLTYRFWMGDPLDFLENPMEDRLRDLQVSLYKNRS